MTGRCNFVEMEHDLCFGGVIPLEWLERHRMGFLVKEKTVTKAPVRNTFCPYWFMRKPV